MVQPLSKHRRYPARIASLLVAEGEFGPSPGQSWLWRGVEANLPSFRGGTGKGPFLKRR